jgi:hypothetical protein
MSFLHRSDPIAAVTSVVADQYYSCPNIASVDRHIGELSAQLAKQSPHADAARGKALREDIDRLLDRRLYLEMVREDGSKPGRLTDTQPRQPTVTGAQPESAGLDRTGPAPAGDVRWWAPRSSPP